jgi:hypothetical protein
MEETFREVVMMNRRETYIAWCFFVFGLVFALPAGAQVNQGKEVVKHKTINGYPAVITLRYYLDDQTLYSKKQWLPEFDGSGVFLGYVTIYRQFTRVFSEELGRQIQSYKAVDRDNHNTEIRERLMRNFYNVEGRVKRHVTYYLVSMSKSHPVMKYLYSYDRDTGKVFEETIEYTDESRNEEVQRCSRTVSFAEQDYPQPRWCMAF